MKIYEKGLPLVIVNPAVAVGVGDIGPGPSGKLILSILKRKIPGYIEGGGNIIDVEDVARGHILAAQKGRIGQRYILGNENLSMAEYFEFIEEVSGIEVLKFKTPYPVALIMGHINQLIAQITRKPPVTTAPMVRIASKYAYLDSSKAINELGLTQTPIKTAIEKSINWFRENGYVRGV
jgi:dihydroflavonol-4-reductase